MSRSPPLMLECACKLRGGAYPLLRGRLLIPKGEELTHCYGRSLIIKGRSLIIKGRSLLLAKGRSLLIAKGEELTHAWCVLTRKAKCMHAQ